MLVRANECAEVFDGLACRIGSLFLGHTVLPYTASLGNLGVLIQSSRHIEAHHRRQEHGAGYAVWHIEECGEGMSHTVVNAQSDIGECHTSHILCHSHTVAALRIGGFVDGNRQILVYHLNGLHLEHIRQLP